MASTGAYCGAYWHARGYACCNAKLAAQDRAQQMCSRSEIHQSVGAEQDEQSQFYERTNGRMGRELKYEEGLARLCSMLDHSPPAIAGPKLPANRRLVTKRMAPFLACRKACSMLQNAERRALWRFHWASYKPDDTRCPCFQDNPCLEKKPRRLGSNRFRFSFFVFRFSFFLFFFFSFFLFFFFPCFLFSFFFFFRFFFSSFFLFSGFGFYFPFLRFSTNFPFFSRTMRQG